MKLRLPLALHAIILACMVNSNVSYATTTPPAEQQANTQDGQGVSVRWRPAPVADEEDAADEPASIGSVDAEKAIPGKKDASNQGIPMDEAEDQPQGGRNSRYGRMLGREKHGSNARLANQPGMQVTSYVDDRGRLVLRFHAGKGEKVDVTPDTVDTYAFWNCPEGYTGTYLPYMFMHDGYSSVWVGSKHVNVPYYSPVPTTTGTNSGGNGGTNATAFHAPAMGGFASPGAPARRRPAAAKKPAVTPATPELQEPAEETGETDTTTQDTTLLTDTTPGTATSDEAPAPLTSASLPEATSLPVRQASISTGTAITLGEPSAQAGPVISGAAATVYSAPAISEANKVTWTPQAGDNSTDLNAAANWNGTVGANTTLVFDHDLSSTTVFDAETVGNNAAGILVTNGASVTMTTKRWLSMIEVDKGASLDLTMADNSTSHASIQIKSNANNTANVYADGSLTIHNAGICLNDWGTGQLWVVGANGQITLDGAITFPTSQYTKDMIVQARFSGVVYDGDTTTLLNRETFTGDRTVIATINGANLTAVNTAGKLKVSAVLEDGSALPNMTTSVTTAGVVVSTTSTLVTLENLVWNGGDGTWGGAGTGGFHKAADAGQTNTDFVNGDTVTFDSAGANATIIGTVKPAVLNVAAATTFTGGAVQTPILNLSSSLTLTGANLTSTDLNVLGNSAISTGVGAGTATSTNINIGGGHTLTIDSGVTATNIKVAANQSGTLSAESSTDITSNVTVAADAHLIVGGQAHLKTRDANGSLSMDSTGKITLLGGDASFYNGKEKYTVKARTDLSEGLSSTIQGSGEVSLFSGNTTISNAVVTFNSFRHVNGTLTNCDVTTAADSENQFLSVQNNIHNLTVQGGTSVKQNMTINGALVVDEGKTLRVDANSAQLTLNGTGTINGTLSITAGQTMLLTRNASMAVNAGGAVNGAGTLIMDMTGRVAGADPIVNAAGTIGVGTIRLDNYLSLTNGAYNLVQAASSDAAETLLGKFSLASNSPLHQYTVSQTDGLVQLVVTGSDADTYNVTANTTWYHNDNYDTSIPVSVANNIKLTISNKNNNTFGDGTHIRVGDVTLGNGSSFWIDGTMNTAHRDISTTNKPVVDSHITLGENSTLHTEDGSWYFKGGLTVAGNATVSNQWDKGIVYGAITGSGTPENDRTLTLTFEPMANGASNHQVIGFVEDGDFGGKVVLKTAVKRNGTILNPTYSHYVLDATNAFRNAEVELANNAELRFDVAEANIRKLSGNGRLVANENQYGGNYTGNTTLNIAEDSTFSGTIGGHINLALGTGAGLTLTGALTLDMTGATTDTAKVSATSYDLTGLTSTNLTNYSGLAHGTYTILQGTTSDQASAIATQIGALANDTILKHYELTTDNGLALNVVGKNALVTWSGSYNSSNNDMAYGVYKYTTYEDGIAIVSNEHVLRSWNGSGTANTSSGDFEGHKTITDLANDGRDVEVNDRAVLSLRFDDSVAADKRAIAASFSPILLGSIIVEEGATGYSLAGSTSKGRNFYLGSSMDDPMHSIINENFAITMSSVHLRGKQNITVAEGKTFTLNVAAVEGDVTMDGAGTITVTGTGNFDVAGANAKLTVTDGVFSTAGNISIYYGASMEMTGGQVNATRFFVHNADGNTKESAVISGGVLNATSDGKAGDNSSSAVMVGHYQQGTQANTLDICGTGVLNAQNGAVVVSWNSPGSLTIGGGGEKANGGELNADGLYFETAAVKKRKST